MRMILFLLALLTTSHAYSQQTADEISDTQIANYQTRLEKKCMETGGADNDASKSAGIFCGCMITVLKEELTHAQWQQVTLFALNQQTQYELSIIGMHMRKAHACQHNSSD